jgi:hypothetical protein
MFKTIVGSRAVEAGAASRSGSDQKMRLRIRNTGKNFFFLLHSSISHRQFVAEEYV